MTAVLPTLIGLGFNVTRAPIWSTNVSRSMSGKRNAIGFYSSPLYQYELTYDVLRSDSVNLEYQSLLGFFNSLHGNLTPFLYTDPDDYTVTLQQIGVGDGVTLAYQLVRTLGGFSEPILAPNTVSKVYVDGVDQAGFWTVSAYGTAAPGVITFSGGHAPTSGKAITATFTYYWPCAFDDATMSFEKFMYQMFLNKSVKFSTLK